MPQFTFRVIWEEDDNIHRDIAIASGQTFEQVHVLLMEALGFKERKASSFYVSDDRWRLKMRISSEVEKNIKGAEALAMKRTPVSALISEPDQKFIYIFEEEGRAWTFQMSLLTIKAEVDEDMTTPRLLKSIGVNPIDTRAQVGNVEEKEAFMEDQYDLDTSSLDEQGFSTEE